VRSHLHLLMLLAAASVSSCLETGGGALRCGQDTLLVDGVCEAMTCENGKRSQPCVPNPDAQGNVFVTLTFELSPQQQQATVVWHDWQGKPAQANVADATDIKVKMTGTQLRVEGWMAPGLHYLNLQFNDGSDLVRTDPRDKEPAINIPLTGIGLYLGESECYVPRRPKPIELCGRIPAYGYAWGKPPGAIWSGLWICNKDTGCKVPDPKGECGKRPEKDSKPGHRDKQ